MRIYWLGLIIGGLFLLPEIQVVGFSLAGRSTAAYVAEHKDLLLGFTVMGCLLAIPAAYKLINQKH